MVAAVACSSPPPTLAGFETSTITVGGEEMTVAVAGTDEQRRQGLRGVEQLPAGIEGMLFIFEPPRAATFGMRNTLMPLDIWWFGEDGRLLGSTEMELCEADCPGYGSPGEVAWALETPRGDVEIQAGDVLTEKP